MRKISELLHHLLFFLLSGLLLFSLLFQLLLSKDLLRRGHIPTLDELGMVLQELLDASTQEVSVLIPFLAQQLGVLRALPLIIHVSDYQLVGLILEAEKLWNCLVAGYIRAWEIDCLLDAPQVVLVRVSKVEQQERCVGRDSKHVSGVGHR